MKLRQRLSRIERQIESRSVKPTRHWLESLMRYVLIHAHLAAVVKLSHKTREEMSEEEWIEFCAISVKHFNAHKQQYKEEDILNHIGATPETLPALISAFLSLPDRTNYEH